MEENEKDKEEDQETDKENDKEEDEENDKRKIRKKDKELEVEEEFLCVLPLSTRTMVFGFREFSWTIFLFHWDITTFIGRILLFKESLGNNPWAPQNIFS